MTATRFEKFAWFFVAYLIAVILFGAWVRISFSGDGCGSHWPTCQGEILPPSPSAKTLTEFLHRASSGLCGVLGLVLVWGARKVGRGAFRASLATLFFLVIEAFIGALLVKKGWVGTDASVGRAITISLHLANTLLLTASAATTAWLASPAPRPGGRQPRTGLAAAALAGMLLTSMSGAVTALGDTLFPVSPAADGALWARLRDGLSPAQHFLVRLRILHPAVALLTAAAVACLFVAYRRAPRADRLTRLADFGLGLVVAQTAVGFLDVMLGAPPWLQLLHLLAAQALWITLWLAVVEAWQSREPTISGLAAVATG
ncbi:MAG: COX15/CtaA family protein [Bryobacterales bacterium]|nr:COX15/CtaA family protein [Bryobacteraceae bacterium]MDW8353164.1 COX15/CtaA family protein [Bryobacterales bacterium]